MRLRDAIVSGALLGALHGGTVAPVAAEPTKGYYSMDAMGCMLLKECTDDVNQVHSIDDFIAAYPEADWDIVADEFNRIMVSFKKIGVNVYLANPKYFPVGHRGVYHTVSNHFYLNYAFMHRPGVMMSVVRHEGWHAAQDCMAGTIKNNMIAIIKPEEDVPMIWQEMVKRTYPAHAQPWEAEATWAGKTELMTQDALNSCANGTMWTDYDPTPLTKEWLEENGYIK